MQLIFPSGLSYGVIKMDPHAMVRDLGLDDSDTLRAVEDIQPKKYLVYLEHVSLLSTSPAQFSLFSLASRHPSAEKSMVSLLCQPNRLHAACKGEWAAS